VTAGFQYIGIWARDYYSGHGMLGHCSASARAGSHRQGDGTASPRVNTKGIIDLVARRCQGASGQGRALHARQKLALRGWGTRHGVVCIVAQPWALGGGQAGAGPGTRTFCLCATAGASQQANLAEERPGKAGRGADVDSTEPCPVARGPMTAMALAGPVREMARRNFLVQV
jgi:hypothetical protein